MQKCPNCGYINRAGVLICERCGTNLVTGKSQIATRALSDEQSQANPEQPQPAEQKPSPAVPPSEKVAGTTSMLSQSNLQSSDVDTVPSIRGNDEFPKGGTLRLEIEGSSKSVQVPLTVHNREIVLGRRDPATGALPDIDLTPFAGYRMGVSRRHSLIRYSEGKYLDIFDQGSSNGTYLNGQRMDAHYPYRIHDGDRIRLGQITVRIHFEPGGSSLTSSSNSRDTRKGTSPLGARKAAPQPKTRGSSDGSGAGPVAPQQPKAQAAPKSEASAEPAQPAPPPKKKPGFATERMPDLEELRKAARAVADRAAKSTTEQKAATTNTDESDQPASSGSTTPPGSNGTTPSTQKDDANPENKKPSS